MGRAPESARSIEFGEFDCHVSRKSARHHRVKLAAQPDRPLSHHLGESHLWVVFRLVARVRDEVKNLIDWPVDNDVALYKHVFFCLPYFLLSN